MLVIPTMRMLPRYIENEKRHLLSPFAAAAAAAAAFCGCMYDVAGCAEGHCLQRILKLKLVENVDDTPQDVVAAVAAVAAADQVRAAQLLTDHCCCL